MLSPVKKRNIELDLIRFTGVLIIMFAHSSPPAWLFQLRNFGTPLLIFGSALTYAYIYRNKTIDRIPFFRKRLTRLIIPVWIFLTFFFLLVFFTTVLLKIDYPFSGAVIFESYSLYYGIGFVWIFKVYIILALITPFGIEWSKSSISNRNYFILIASGYLLYELFVFLFFKSIPIPFREFVATVFLVVIPYSALYLYGLRAHSLSKKQLGYIIVTSLLLFMLLAIEKRIDFGNFIQTQNYKYPPTLYYLSYAFFCTNLIYYLVFEYLKSDMTWLNNIIVWLSTNSLWIYLWHIVGYYLWGFLISDSSENVSYTFIMFLVKFLYLLIFGVLFCFIQISIVNKLLPKSNSSLQKFLSFLK